MGVRCVAEWHTYLNRPEEARMSNELCYGVFSESNGKKN